MAIVCERFTTSKLKHFDDLKTIGTFGFRGEALASITHVAFVTITTKTADSPCAYKAKYVDGSLAPIKPGDKADPKPCAGVTGTTICVEDLFYNLPARKNAFKNPNEQYLKILDVVTKYSIHFGGRKIAFTCKKHGQPSPDLHTPNTSSVLDNIKIAYGSATAKELIDLNLSSSPEHAQAPGDFSAARGEDGVIVSTDCLEFSLKGKISNANYSSKKFTMILFINNRLVESQSIRRVVDSVYADILPK